MRTDERLPWAFHAGGLPVGAGKGVSGRASPDCLSYEPGDHPVSSIVRGWRAAGSAGGRLGGVGERPERECLHALEVVVRPVVGRGLRELDPQAGAPKGPTRLYVPNDGAEAGYKAHMHRGLLYPSELPLILALLRR